MKKSCRFSDYPSMFMADGTPMKQRWSFESGSAAVRKKRNRLFRMPIGNLFDFFASGYAGSGGFVKFLLPTLILILLLSTAAPLFAGEVIIYGGSQKPGEVSWKAASNVIGDLKGDFGGAFGIRYSAGRVIDFEQSIGYSPRFAKPRVALIRYD